MADCKLTPEVTEIIVQFIEKGNTYETAAQAVGICRQTLHNWMKRGEKEEPDFLRFLQDIKKAKAKAETKHIEIIEKAMDKNWQAAAWWLERSNKEQWGMRQEVKMEHSGKITFGQLREILKTDEQQPAGNDKTTSTNNISIPDKTTNKPRERTSGEEEQASGD